MFPRLIPLICYRTEIDVKCEAERGNPFLPTGTPIHGHHHKSSRILQWPEKYLQLVNSQPRIMQL